MDETRTVLLEIKNLRYMTDEHRGLCMDPDCGISVYLAKLTAQRLLPLLDEKDRREADAIMASWPL